MISFVIPAHNEEKLLPRTLDALHSAAQATGKPYEIIVVDDASTDATAKVASEKGAKVVTVDRRQIAAVRNDGAKVAKGDPIIFVDADTVIPVKTLQAALQALDDGVIGGGITVGFDEELAFFGRFLLGVWNVVSRWRRWAAGCFIFVRRDAFEAVGGFDEQYYVGEEIFLSTALQSRGRFVILRETVFSSARKTKTHTAWETLKVIGRLIILGKKGWKKREGLDMWYVRRDTK